MRNAELNGDGKTAPSSEVICGDNRVVMAGMEAERFHACVCNPPYGLEFMGEEWDKLAVPKPGHLGGFADGNKPSFARVGKHLAEMQEWHGLWLAEAYRVLKPGAFLLAFGGTRTWHRLACAIEDAGFELRGTIMWLYGQGFPKSYDVAQSVEKIQTLGCSRRPDRDLGGLSRDRFSGREEGTLIANTGGKLPLTTDAARQWQGWGTALKPAWEPILVARKPLCGTVAENVLAHGCGGINVDGCRIEAFGGLTGGGRCVGQSPMPMNKASGINEDRPRSSEHPLGRWPANICLDEEAAAMLDEQSGERRGCASASRPTGGQCENAMFAPGSAALREWYGDIGGASRFFYCAKASRAEREAGLDNVERAQRDEGRKDGNPGGDNPRNRGLSRVHNHHPTVKPLALMRWLVRLVTPPGGIVLDPFCGSGTTGCACAVEGFNFVGIDQDAGYCEIARRRIEYWGKASTTAPPSPRLRRATGDTPVGATASGQKLVQSNLLGGEGNGQT